MKPPLASESLLSLSKDLISEAGTDLLSASGSLAGAASVLEDLHQHLRGLIGDRGYASLMGLSRQRALGSHPILEALRISGDGRLSMEPMAFAEAELQEEFPGAIVAFLAETLVLVRDLARDQDWSLVPLWPQLDRLEAEGLLRSPEEET
jgi:hypothetical protein